MVTGDHDDVFDDLIIWWFDDILRMWAVRNNQSDFPTLNQESRLCAAHDEDDVTSDYDQMYQMWLLP